MLPAAGTATVTFIRTPILEMAGSGSPTNGGGEGERNGGSAMRPRTCSGSRDVGRSAC